MFTHSFHAKQEGERISFGGTKTLKELPTQDRTFHSQEDEGILSVRASTFTESRDHKRCNLLSWEADVLPVWTNSAQFEF